MQLFRPCLILALSLVLCLPLLACSGKKNPWIAPDQSQILAEKVKNNRNAYLRYSQAEEDARKDGSAEAVEHYGRAKEQARLELERAEKELAAYQSSTGLAPQKKTP